MKRSRSSLFCAPLIVGASALLAAGCRHRTPVPTGGAANPVDVPAGGKVPAVPQPPAKAKDMIQVSLLTDKTTYKQGDTLKLTIVARNDTDKPLSILLNTGQKFDVEATREGETQPVWRWSKGRVFTMMISKVTLAPKEEKRYQGTWDGKTVTDDGTPGDAVPPGRYILRAKLASTDDAYAPPVTIEITQ